jgi:pyruvate dehydrogenase (quinone)
VQIDIDGRLLGIRYPMELNLVGDSRETLRALLPRLKHKKDRSWSREIQENVERWWRVVEARAMVEAHPVNPQRVFWELSPRLPDGAIVTCDSGSSANWYARDLKIREGMRCSLSGTLATMGSGVPYAVAAKFAFPNRPVICLSGDGAMQMNGMNELLTIAKYWKEWSDPRLIMLVLHNNDLNQVTWEMRAFEGDAKFPASQDLPDFNYARYAQLCGLKGLSIRSADEIVTAWDEAFSSDRPVLIDALVDPSVPPLPPHITFKEARAMVSSILKGDPDAGEVVRHSFKGKIRELVPAPAKSSRGGHGRRNGNGSRS